MVSVAVAAPAEVRALLHAAQSEKTDPGARYCVDSMIAQGTCWKMVEEGAIVGALLTTESDGALWVSIAAGRSPCDLVDVLADHLMRQAAGRYKAIGFQTARPGLVRKAERHGYKVEAYIMRKNL